MEKLLLGIDIGTSAVKACLFNEDLHFIAGSNVTYETYRPGPMMAEQDPEDWWDAVVQAVREAFGQCGARAEAAAISVSSHSPTLLALDKDGKPLRNAIIWMDRRAQAESDEFAYEILGAENYRRILGSEPDAYYVMPKLLWYRRNEPELYGKTRTILQTNGYINYKLTGEYSLDEIHAVSVQGMDINTRQWSSEIEAAAEIRLSELFPPISPCYGIIGRLLKKPAEELGLRPGVPVMAGSTDTMAAFTAFGRLDGDTGALMAGTSSLIFIPAADRGGTSCRLLYKPSPLTGLPGIYVGPVSTTGGAAKWFVEQFCVKTPGEVPNSLASTYAQMDREADASIPGSGGVIFHPYLSGERAPLWNSHAKGVFTGMTLSTSRGDLYRAVMEGTSFAERHVFDEGQKAGSSPSSVRVAGGAAQSKIWLKIKASILRKPLEILESGGADRAAFGNAVLAGYGCGLLAENEIALENLAVTKDTVYPDPEWEKIYDEYYGLYRSIYEHTENDLRLLEAIRKREV